MYARIWRSGGRERINDDGAADIAAWAAAKDLFDGLTGENAGESNGSATAKADPLADVDKLDATRLRGECRAVGGDDGAVDSVESRPLALLAVRIRNDVADDSFDPDISDSATGAGGDQERRRSAENVNQIPLLDEGGGVSTGRAAVVQDVDAVHRVCRVIGIDASVALGDADPVGGDIGDAGRGDIHDFAIGGFVVD